MAIDTVFSAVLYDGNNSISTPYPVGFPYLSPGDIHVFILTPGAGTVSATAGVVSFTAAQPTLKPGSRVRVGTTVYLIATRTNDFTFTFTERPTLSPTVFFLPDDAGELAGNGWTLAADGVRTAAPVPATSRVLLQRRTPLTQPAVLPASGALPATTLETMADRLTMIAQEQRSTETRGGIAMPAGEGDPFQDTASFEDAAARAAARPKRRGQVGVQLDDHTVWVAGSTDAGDWQAPAARPAAMADGVVLGFTGDAGQPGAAQTALANALAAAGLEGVIFAGDNSYSAAASFEADWAAFSSWVNARTAYAVMGNHDLDDPAKRAQHVAKFSWLGNGRYWKVTLGNGLVDLFGLNDGVNTAYDNPVTYGEPHGNTVGSLQHTWFVEQLNASTARWKLVVVHHPPVSSENDGNTVVNALNWPEFRRVDAILCGHTHLAEWLTYRGTPLLNASGAVKTDGDCSLALQGTYAGQSTLVWAEDRLPVFGRLLITPADITVQYLAVNGGHVVYQRSLAEKETPVSEIPQELVAPASPVNTGIYVACLAASSMLVNDWFVAAYHSGSSPLSGYIYVASANPVPFTIPAGQYWTRVYPTDPKVFIGQLIHVHVTANESYPAWTGLKLVARARVIS